MMEIATHRYGKRIKLLSHLPIERDFRIRPYFLAA
jgi:hypothetical protein